MNTSKRTTFAALSVAAALALTACGSDDTAPEGATSPETTTSETASSETTAQDTGTSSPTDTSGATAPADLETVIATAEEEAGGTAYEIDDQDDDGSWEVDVAVDGSQSVEVTVSADGSEVVGTDDEDDLDDEDRRGLEAAEITVGEAVTAALDEADGTFDDAELEEEDGSWHWEVSVDRPEGGDDDVEVHVDVTDGRATVDDTATDDGDDSDDG